MSKAPNRSHCHYAPVCPHRGLCGWECASAIMEWQDEVESKTGARPEFVSDGDPPMWQGLVENGAADK